MVKIFVGRLSESVTKEKLEELFSKYGEVVDAEVLKNFGFVHMSNKKEAEKAISELDKTEVDGSKINVEFSVTKVATAAKIFVGNLAEGTQSHELHKLFKKYGTVIECDVVKNFAFVHMSREAQAREAIRELDDYELKGNKIRVQMARVRAGQGNRGGFGPLGSFSGRAPGLNPRFNPYDTYEMHMSPRSRNFHRPHVGRMHAYEGAMRRDVAMGFRRGNRSAPYARLLCERALLSRRLMSERDVMSFRDPYCGASNGGTSRLSRPSSASYTDFAVDEFGDLPLGDGYDLEPSVIDRFGGTAGYGSAYDDY